LMMTCATFSGAISNSMDVPLCVLDGHQYPARTLRLDWAQHPGILYEK